MTVPVPRTLSQCSCVPISWIRRTSLENPILSSSSIVAMRMAREHGDPVGQTGCQRHQTAWPTLPCPPSFTICHKTEVVKNTLNPVWQPFTIPVRALCNGDYDRYRNGDGDRDTGSHGARAGTRAAMGPEQGMSSSLWAWPCSSRQLRIGSRLGFFSFATQIT